MAKMCVCSVSVHARHAHMPPEVALGGSDIHEKAWSVVMLACAECVCALSGAMPPLQRIRTAACTHNSRGCVTHAASAGHGRRHSPVSVLLEPQPQVWRRPCMHAYGENKLMPLRGR
mmetsp:Transcript_41784/g.125026  ORF Transcript_41784/g.125026 Transcript_41784/m.125026 type:complete len:117 (-) Transcript_41784:717-1067(-)